MYDREYNSQLDSYEEEYSEYGHKYKRTVEFFSESITPRKFIPSPESSQKPKPSKKKYGLYGITQYGKLTVRCIALLMQKKYGKARLGFGTCTLPNYSPDVLLILSQHWNNISRQFYQQLKREFKKIGAPLEYVGVTEIQPERFRKRGEVAPHLHFVYVAKPKYSKNYYISADRFRVIWRQILKCFIRKYCIHAFQQDAIYNASVNVQSVKRNAANYLSKYISKGVKIVSEIIAQGCMDALPSQWWTASMQSKKMFKESIIPLYSEHAEHIFYNVNEWIKNKDILKYVDIFRIYNGEERRFGMFGVISENMYNFLFMYAKGGT